MPPATGNATVTILRAGRYAVVCGVRDLWDRLARAWEMAGAWIRGWR